MVFADVSRLLLTTATRMSCTAGQSKDDRQIYSILVLIGATKSVYLSYYSDIRNENICPVFVRLVLTPLDSETGLTRYFWWWWRLLVQA